jgi:predicted metalloprotease with PDZ domain
MVNKFSLGVAICIFSISSVAQTTTRSNVYKFFIDMVNVNDDKVKVELLTPAITKKTITYYIPRIVPGTYSEDDYGRYIEQFKAFDKKGNTLNVVKNDVNSWAISNADKLYKLSYFVNDSYDDTTTRQVIFEPAGSNIRKDTNYVLNNHCFLGYFDEMKNINYEVNIKHPANMYGSTALTDIDKSNTSDKFITESYNRIVDNPFMYNMPDTSFIKVGNTDVLISVYSPGKKITSKFFAEKLDTLLQAQGKYLGGKLPVDKYAFIIYLSETPGHSGGEGALEHSYCSFYYYPEREPGQLSTEFVNHAAHEFFHIITPLTIHSEEIQFFDFNYPKMSRHLWLYEGSTEYHAHMVQEKYGLISVEELLDRISGKISTSKNNYNDTVPFTTMSSGVLTTYHKQFGNVYQKGALINMCLDIKLLQLSMGKYGIMNLIHDLSQKYGKEKGFKDDELFSEIGKLTYPEIKQFLDTYVGDNQPLPLEQILNIVGVNYQANVETKDSIFSMGKVSLGFNPASGHIIVTDTAGMNALGQNLGYHHNDEIISVNGENISTGNANHFFQNFGNTSNPGDAFVIKVIRKDVKGTRDTMELKSVMTRFPKFKSNALELADNPSQQQLLIRNAWLKPQTGNGQ